MGEKEGRKVVRAEEILGKIERGEPVEYERVTVGQGLDLTRLKLPKDEDGKLIVSSPIIIVNSHVQGIVKFEDIVFEEPIYFHNTKFDLASFQGAKFCKYAGFEDTVFSRYGQFSHVHFMGDANFTNVRFIGGANAWFYEAKFNGITFFWSKDDGSTMFSGEVCFRFAEFGEGVTFYRAIFCEKADFRLTRFNGEHVLFIGAHFKGESDFQWARFKGEADFRWAQFNKNLILTRSKFTSFEVEWDAVKDRLDCDGTVYLALVKSFRNLERFDDADNCYYQYRKISQSKKHWYEKEKLWLHRFNWSKLYDFVALVSCGYGVRLIFTIVWILCSILGFTIFYRIFNGISKSYPPEITMTALNNSTLLFSSAAAETSPSFWECLYFSAVSFAGGTPVGLAPIGGWKYAVMAESILGYLFLALFIVVLARKLIR